MSEREIFKAILHHRTLATKRSLTYGREKKARMVMYIVGVVFAIYLLSLAILLAEAVNEQQDVKPSAWLLSGIPFILLFDFIIRFIIQQTPAQMIKPYLLLPIRKFLCIDAFIFKSIFNWDNISWNILFIPYAIMTMTGREGFPEAVVFIIVWQIVIFISSQTYLICRSFIKDSIFWIILPVVLFAVMALPGLIPEPGIEGFFDFYYAYGMQLMNGNILSWLLLIGTFFATLIINRQVQYRHVMAETNRQKTSTQHINSYNFFDRWGQIGEYMKLEVKLILRNKQPRNSTITIWLIVILLWFTQYPLPKIGDFAENTTLWNTTGNFFWCLYVFSFPGVITLQRLMAYEGNYIDCLMMQRENILKLFKAKYYFYTAVLVFPLILGIISISMGYWSVILVIANLLYTIGPIYCMCFHLAIYNKDTMPLNASFTHHTGSDIKFWPSLITILTFSLPMLVVWIASTLFGENIACIIIIVISIPFIIFHNQWLRRIYKKLMKVKYENIESLRTSR